MYNTIFQVINSLRTALLPIGLPIYKEVKPSSADGISLVLSYMPIYSNNVNSINDVYIFLYVPKVSDMADTLKIQQYSLEISNILSNFKSSVGFIHFNKQKEPITKNMDDMTVTVHVYKTINS